MPMHIPQDLEYNIVPTQSANYLFVYSLTSSRKKFFACFLLGVAILHPYEPLPRKVVGMTKSNQTRI